MFSRADGHRTGSPADLTRVCPIGTGPGVRPFAHERERRQPLAAAQHPKAPRPARRRPLRPRAARRAANERTSDDSRPAARRASTGLEGTGRRARSARRTRGGITSPLFEQKAAARFHPRHEMLAACRSTQNRRNRGAAGSGLSGSHFSSDSDRRYAARLDSDGTVVLIDDGKIVPAKRSLSEAPFRNTSSAACT